MNLRKEKEWVERNKKVVRLEDRIKRSNIIINMLSEEDIKLKLQREILENKSKEIEEKYLLEKMRLQKEDIALKEKILAVKQIINILEKINI